MCVLRIPKNAFAPFSSDQNKKNMPNYQHNYEYLNMYPDNLENLLSHPFH